MHVVSFLAALLAQLLGVTATCALELGVDIGELDVTLHLGFPGKKLRKEREAFVPCSIGIPWWLFTISIHRGEQTRSVLSVLSVVLIVASRVDGLEDRRRRCLKRSSFFGSRAWLFIFLVQCNPVRVTYWALVSRKSRTIYDKSAHLRIF